MRKKHNFLNFGFIIFMRKYFCLIKRKRCSKALKRNNFLPEFRHQKNHRHFS